MDVNKLLDELSETYSARDLAQIQKQELINTVLTPEIRQQLADIEAEFTGKAQSLNERAARLEAEIKQAVLQGGKTAKGAYLMAVFNAPRVTWDTKGLDGFAVAHPEIVAFRKVGEPTVTLRRATS